MLHIVKQIKKGFIGFLMNNFLSSGEASKVADITDGFGETIDNSEINKLITSNKKLSLKVRKEAKKVYEKLQKTQGNDVIKSDFFKLLTKQEAEHKNVLTKHESEKRTIRKETHEKQNEETILDTFKKISKLYKKFGNMKEVKNNISKTEIKNLQKALLTLNPNSLPTYGADGDLGDETMKELNRVYKTLEKKNVNVNENKANVNKAKEKTETEKYEEIISNFDVTKDRNNITKVKELQRALQALGHNIDYKGHKGDKAIDGKMSLKGKTMKAYKSEINTLKLTSDLTMVADYTEAYSNVYGDMDKIINRHHGVLGQILKYTSDSDVSKLQSTLEIKYPDSAKENKLIKEFKLDTNSPEYDKGLMRIVTALVISGLTTAITSGGDTIDLLVEAFGINKNKIGEIFGIKDWGVSYKKSLSPEEIVKILTGKTIDYKKDAQLAYLSGMKTNSEIKRVLKASLRVDIPNLKRVTDTIKDNNFFEDFIELFDNKIGNLIDSLEGETNPKKIDDIMGKIGLLILPELYEAQKSGNEEAKKAYVELAGIIGRYNNIEKKYDKVNGIGLDISRIKELSTKADKGIKTVYKRKGIDIKLTTNTKNLHSKGSFGYNLNKVKDFKEYTKELASHTYKKGGESMLATIMATVAEQTSGISFSPDHFIEGMENMKKVSNSDKVKILSNLGRGKGQKFQGTLKTALGNGTLYEMKIDGATIYFKDKCTNPVAVVNDLTTTVQFAGSIPVYAKLNIKDKPTKTPDEGPTPDKDPTKPTDPTQGENPTGNENPTQGENPTPNENGSTTTGVQRGDPATNIPESPTQTTGTVSNTGGVHEEGIETAPDGQGGPSVGPSR